MCNGTASFFNMVCVSLQKNQSVEVYFWTRSPLFPPPPHPPLPPHWPRPCPGSAPSRPLAVVNRLMGDDPSVMRVDFSPRAWSIFTWRTEKQTVSFKLRRAFQKVWWRKQTQKISQSEPSNPAVRLESAFHSFLCGAG